ncbi:MAG TPA: hypothetical protein VE621_01285 [Bryobacteraceae bacterium]|jgi:hypothetical protein|nr:hypothetical protein [Bryobacteraceae bacterium]
MSTNAFGASAIGQISAKGAVQVDAIRSSDTATVFEGSRVQTFKAASEISLAAGTRYSLAPESRGQVFKDQLRLESGTAVIQGAQGVVPATGLVIKGGTQESVARLSLLAANRTRVEAVRGDLSVWNANGLLLAKVAGGSALDVTGQSGPGQQVKVTGRVFKKDGKLFLRDEATQTVFELKSANLKQYVGQRVELTGKLGNGPVAAGATHTLEVASTSKIAAAGAAAGAGISKTAIIAGVTIATAGGVGLSVGLTQSEETATVSR